MSTSPDLLAALGPATAALQRTADGLTDPAGPSLCAGWTRGHVLTHLARNAEAMAGLCRAAVDGTDEPMYPSSEARDADIDAGARRDAAALAEDLRCTAPLAAEGLARLRPEHADRILERTPGDRSIRAERLPFMRLREVVYHHVDLDAGYGFGDVDPDLLLVLLDDEVGRLRAVDEVPDVTLRTPDGDEWTVGLGTVEVTGDRAGLLGWLARGLTDGVQADPLPRLPEGR